MLPPAPPGADWENVQGHWAEEPRDRVNVGNTGVRILLGLEILILNLDALHCVARAGGFQAER